MKFLKKKAVKKIEVKAEKVNNEKEIEVALGILKSVQDEFSQVRKAYIEAQKQYIKAQISPLMISESSETNVVKYECKVGKSVIMSEGVLNFRENGNNVELVIYLYKKDGSGLVDKARIVDIDTLIRSNEA